MLESQYKMNIIKVGLKIAYYRKLSEENGISFNKVVNQCIEYALDNLEEEN